MGQKNRYAARGASALIAATVGLGLAFPVAASAATAPPAPDPGWGVMQERPPLSESQNTEGEAPAPKPSLSADSGGTASKSLAAAPATPGWVLNGSGWGHGLGMSQFGAWEMAKDGSTAKDILGHYYSGTSYDAVQDNQTLDVNIINSTTTVTAVSSALAAGGGDFTVNVAGISTLMRGKAGQAVTFTRSGDKIKASCTACTGATTLAGTVAILQWDQIANDKTLMKMGGTQYRDGVMRLRPIGSSSFNVVNRVRLHDEYLDYLREMPWSWSLEAKKAQAAAARGYALTKYNNGLRTSCDCHVYDTTMDQVYGGYPTSGDLPYWQGWKDAVRATTSSTTGYVARSGGKIIQAFYSSSSGGRTENNEEVWGGTPVSYLRGVGDSYSLRTSNPLRTWRQVTNGSSMAQAFRLSDVARLDLRSRTTNGGIRWAKATSASGATSTISGDQFRTIVASGSAYSSRVNSTMIKHETQRLSGSDRYATAAAVAKTVAAGATSVVVASGEGLPDASVAGPLAATVNAPLLLTKPGGLPAATQSELTRRGSAVKTAYVIGSSAVVGDAVVKQLRDRGMSVVRLGGSTRYSTAAKVAQEIAKHRTVTAAVIAGGDGIVDAVSASGPAAALREPILLTPVSSLAWSTESQLKAMGVKYIHIVGGTPVVGQKVEDKLRASYTVRRLSGADRYATSAAVAGYFRGQIASTEMVITAGSDASLVDSLVAGTRQRLMVLVNPASLPETAAETMQRTPALELVTAVGSSAVVSNGVLTAASRS
jgi:SpoIID/LytB domain protein